MNLSGVFYIPHYSAWSRGAKGFGLNFEVFFFLRASGLTHEQRH